MNKQELGKYGENIAVAYLESAGYGIIDRRFTTSSGEIDIVARNEQALIFVEVKSRSSYEFGHGAEAIGPLKLERMKVCFLEWIRARNVKTSLELRLDLISILIEEGKSPYLEHFEAVS
ncbi:MAG: YraN family protein [Micrococcaceae bacterium]